MPVEFYYCWSCKEVTEVNEDGECRKCGVQSKP